jgi:RNA polymerase sigma-70 factor, ECF subfamily
MREAAVEVSAGEAEADLETIFNAHYERIARVIARVIRDHARAEDLAVEVFLKWSRSPEAHGAKAAGWLFRAAERASLNELRRQARRRRYEGILRLVRLVPTPEQISVANEEQDQVRSVLAAIDPRKAEMLLLRSHGFSYSELASTLDLNSASIGTLLSRAEQSFRKEFVNRYGK